MDDLVKAAISRLQGDVPFNGWTGFGYPTEIQKKCNLWVSKAGARTFTRGFMCEPRHTRGIFAEFGFVVKGKIRINWGDNSCVIKSGMFYTISSGNDKIEAHILEEPFIIWIEISGLLTDDFIEELGGQYGSVSAGQADFEQVRSLLNIAYLLHAHLPGYNFTTQAMLWHFIADFKGYQLKRKKCSPSIAKVVDYFHTMPAEEDVSIENLAKIAQLSEETFRKRFKSEVGEPPMKYFMHLRISNAKNLLADETKSIKEVAYEVGFSDQYYFSRQFKHYEGISPSVYRQRMYQLYPSVDEVELS